MKVIVLLSLLVALSYGQTQTAYTLTQAERDTFLNAHNAVRKVYGLSAFTWDSQLEADSAAWAAQCKVNPLTHSVANGAYGENLSTYMAIPKPATWPYKTMDYHVVSGWYSEEKYWNCQTNTCTTSGGGQCGHLTQIVWASTTTVGCGIAYCNMVSSGKTWFVQNAVCRYKTAGNYVGKHPLDPAGSSATSGASKCPNPYPTTLGPIQPTPVAPVTPVKAPTPVAPVPVPTKVPTVPTAPTATPIAPKAPTATPTTAPKAPTVAPLAPTTAPKVAGVWWSECISDYWPKDSTGKQYQKLTPCAWEPWKETSSGKTWCCPDPTDEWGLSWPVYNLGAANCPDGKALSYAKLEENASPDGEMLPMGAWIGIAVAIAVVIIVIIVVIIIIQKKKNDERV